MRYRFTVILAETIATESGIYSRPESQPESGLAARVVFLLRNEALSKSAMASGLGHKTVSGELKRQVKKLLESGIIEMTIPEKPNNRLQKYRLTEKGRGVLRESKKVVMGNAG